MIRKILTLLFFMAVSILITACGNNESSENIISVVGSSSVAPLIEAVSENYLRVKNIEVDVQSVGSSAGIKAAIDGTANIGMSSRNLKKEEKEGLNQYIIALDGIAVILHPDNTVKNLSKDQILKIFSGEITNWKDVGGKDAPIVVVSREEGSGTRGAFEEIIGLEVKDGDLKKTILSKKAIITDGNGSVKQNIALKPNGIGYISVGSVDNSVQAVFVDGVAPSEKNIKEGKYLITRPFILMTKGAPTTEAKAFIDFILSPEGQKIVKEHYYITVTDI
ncbi:MAG: phosphate ABC transporter substrate-binding protein [Fusobacteria bacterium]|nr:phosphate ABC transporter substrate-binding protein [Fusobacteriota bacterium]